MPLMKSDKPLPRGLVIGGLECGAWLALGYIAQVAALQDLPAGAVAFLASLQVVFEFRARKNCAGRENSIHVDFAVSASS